MTKELKELFSASAARSWEWDEMHVYRHPRERRKYIFVSGSGCSCDYYEQPTYEQAEAMTPLGKREVYAKFSEWWDSTDPYERPGAKVDYLQRLRDAL